MKIKSAQLVSYNANERGKNVGDCVKRSLSLATDTSYSDIGKELMKKVKEIYPRSYSQGQDGLWKRSNVYDKVIEAHGGTKHKHEEVDGIITLEDFVDNVLPKKGTFLITTGSKPGTHNHIVCVIDGKVYDSWDSRNEYVWCYYTFDNVTTERKAEVDVASLNYDQVQNLLDDLDFAQRVKAKVEGMLHKKGYDNAVFKISRLGVINYKITLGCKLEFPPFAGQDKWRNYSFKVDIVASPFETAESFAKLVDKAVNVRTYDRVYAILQNEKEEHAGWEVLDKLSQYDDEYLKKRLHKNLYMTTAERRFFNTLPGWARALTTYISINQPGEYSDSYELYMVPLPDDPYHPQSDTIMIRGFDADDFRHHLEHYRETYKEHDPNW